MSGWSECEIRAHRAGERTGGKRLWLAGTRGGVMTDKLIPHFQKRAAVLAAQQSSPDWLAALRQEGGEQWSSTPRPERKSERRKDKSGRASRREGDGKGGGGGRRRGADGAG